MGFKRLWVSRPAGFWFQGRLCISGLAAGFGGRLRVSGLTLFQGRWQVSGLAADVRAGCGFLVSGPVVYFRAGCGFRGPVARFRANSVSGLVAGFRAGCGFQGRLRVSGITACFRAGCGFQGWGLWASVGLKIAVFRVLYKCATCFCGLHGFRPESFKVRARARAPDFRDATCLGQGIQVAGIWWLRAAWISSVLRS